jgi:hypothetical protein
MVKTHSKELLNAHHCVLFFLGGAFFNFNNVNTICQWFRHKLNYFLFFQNFEKIFTTCVKILIIIINQILKCFVYQVWTSNLPFLEVKNVMLETHLDCLTTTTKFLFIVLYKYYLPKISELKKPIAKVKIWNLINYSIVCYWICLSAMILRMIYTTFFQIMIRQSAWWKNYILKFLSCDGTIYLRENNTYKIILKYVNVFKIWLKLLLICTWNL